MLSFHISQITGQVDNIIWRVLDVMSLSGGCKEYKFKFIYRNIY